MRIETFHGSAVAIVGFGADALALGVVDRLVGGPAAGLIAVDAGEHEIAGVVEPLWRAVRSEAALGAPSSRYWRSISS